MKPSLIELPQTYLEDDTIDQQSSKYQLISTLISLVILFITLTVGILIYNLVIDNNDESILSNFDAVKFMVITISLILLIITINLLTNYLLLRIIFKKKPKLLMDRGVIMFVIPDTYLFRNYYLLTYLIPLLLGFLIFFIPLFFIKDSLLFFTFLLAFGFQLSFFISEVDLIMRLLFKYKKTTLIKNNGTKRIIYKEVIKHE